MRKMKDIIEQCVNEYNNKYCGEITEDMKFSDLLEIYKIVESENNEKYNSYKDVNKFIHEVDILICAVYPTGCKVCDIKTETIITMLVNSAKKKIGFSTIQIKMKHIKASIGLYESVVGKQVMIPLAPAFYFDMLPEHRKGISKEDRNKYCRERNKKEKEYKNGMVEKEKDINKTKDGEAEKANREARRVSDNIIIVGLRKQEPLFKDLKRGDCFILKEDANSLYMKINIKDCKENAMCLNDGTTECIDNYCEIIKIKIDVVAEVLK